VQEAAPTIGLKTQIFNTATIGEINAAFATFERERPDALSGGPPSTTTALVRGDAAPEAST
jgi:hypothetical protein